MNFLKLLILIVCILSGTVYGNSLDDITKLESESHLRQAITYVNIASNTHDNNYRSENLKNALAELEQAYKKIVSRTACGNNTSDINSFFAKILTNRGLVNLLLGNPNIALEDLNRAKDCDSKNSVIHYNFAIYYAILKKNDLALQAFDTALTEETVKANTIRRNTISEEFTNTGRSFCTELKNNDDLNELKKTAEFKIILEKHNISCPDLMRRKQ